MTPTRSFPAVAPSARPADSPASRRTSSSTPSPSPRPDREASSQAEPPSAPSPETPHPVVLATAALLAQHPPTAATLLAPDDTLPPAASPPRSGRHRRTPVRPSRIRRAWTRAKSAASAVTRYALFATRRLLRPPRTPAPLLPRISLPCDFSWGHPPLRLAGALGNLPLLGLRSHRNTTPTWLILATVLTLSAASAALLDNRADAQPTPEQPGRLAWPLTPRPHVTRNFEPPATPFGPGHRGVDLEAAAGQQVLAADMGVVIFAGQVAGQGVVALDHDGGLHTTYLPITPTVAPGDQIYRGQPLGTAMPGHPGCPTAACLHWGARRGTEYIDPLALVGDPSRVRLKPWAEGP
ncbi:M23 family metallopeptidase [Amycolatopsis sp. cg13]|uniref:M23 family metallopeptidase n=1 Tax=Amycolatopsis sp. cg13 TaxID=3238807 RepID=UPI00352562A0